MDKKSSKYIYLLVCSYRHSPFVKLFLRAFYTHVKLLLETAAVKTNPAIRNKKAAYNSRLTQH